MKDKCLNTKKKTIGNWNVLLNKEFCTNGISLRVETRIALFDEKHLIDKTVKKKRKSTLPSKNHRNGYFHLSHCKIHSNAVPVEIK